MKKLYIFIVCIFLAASCKNIQKMVDKGEYDKAIFYAAEKLQGEENKKTKYVKGLEEAFFKVTQRDLDKIDYLTARNNPENWDRIYDLYGVIKNRQQKITPFLPLVSKDGYVASFRFVKVNEKMAEVAALASEYHYAEGLASLERAKSGDKLAARRAFDRFDKISKYTSGYKDENILMEEAHHIGKTRVLLELVNDSPVIMHEDFERRLLSMDYRALNGFWIEYFADHSDGMEMDIRVTLEVDHLDVSPEREIVDRHTDEAKVKDGYKFIIEKYYETDSLGNKIEKSRKVQKEKFKKVYADVVVVERTKEAVVNAFLRYTDLATGEEFHQKPIAVNALFEDRGVDYYGDHRALCGKHSKHRNTVDHFPSDHDLLLIASDQMKNKVYHHLDTYVF